MFGFGGGELRRLIETLNKENDELREILRAQEERIDLLLKLVHALRTVNADLDEEKADASA